MKNRYLIIPFLLFTFACSSEKQNNSKSDILKNTQQIQLEGETARLKIPNYFKRSSRYRIEKDIPGLAVDSLTLAITQNQLQNLEFEDSQIDLFVDTLSPFHFFFVVNTKHVPFSDQQANYVNTMFTSSMEKLDQNSPFIQIEKVASNIRKSKKWKYMKFKFRFENLIDADRSFMQTTFFLTSSIQTYIIHEFNLAEEDIEKSLWTFKD